jgi:hypothetical protein
LKGQVMVISMEQSVDAGKGREGRMRRFGRGKRESEQAREGRGKGRRYQHPLFYMSQHPMSSRMVFSPDDPSASERSRVWMTIPPNCGRIPCLCPSLHSVSQMQPTHLDDLILEPTLLSQESYIDTIHPDVSFAGLGREGGKGGRGRDDDDAPAPMVGSLFSVKSFETNRRTREDLPTAASPTQNHSKEEGMEEGRS